MRVRLSLSSASRMRVCARCARVCQLSHAAPSRFGPSPRLACRGAVSALAPASGVRVLRRRVRCGMCDCLIFFS